MSEDTLSAALAAEMAKALPQQSKDARFYLAMAIASACFVFFGFARTYYLKSHFGTPQLRPLLHLHGFVFSAWMVFFVMQTALIASNRHGLHRRLGYAGGILAGAMVVVGLMVAFSAERLGHGNAFIDADAIFLISLGDIFTFAIFVGAGFFWRQNREAHQRLMLLAVVAGLLSATIVRLPLIGGHPAGMAITGLALIFAGPVYDFVMRRRIHPAYIWGCLFALVTFVPVRIAVASTPTWHQIAKWLVSF